MIVDQPTPDYQPPHTESRWVPHSTTRGTEIHALTCPGSTRLSPGLAALWLNRVQARADLGHGNSSIYNPCIWRSVVIVLSRVGLWGPTLEKLRQQNKI
ncbi:hypothetical protein PanWU01x14_199810 [Parasponia andersonii]|uniref:Uncharacterized protein n=1 Tax=Parasponia andersonii TaxID=3476 RepID=A0A2P5BYI5_PARAD|nr:hypothetical protein PanWU01x14_199810 [Parasponia andersonii]